LPDDPDRENRRVMVFASFHVSEHRHLVSLLATLFPGNVRKIARLVVPFIRILVIGEMSVRDRTMKSFCNKLMDVLIVSFASHVQLQGTITVAAKSFAALAELLRRGGYDPPEVPVRARLIDRKRWNNPPLLAILDHWQPP
jgi:hypothetical protein